MAAHSALYQAPFAPGGGHAIDEAMAWRLLSAALAKGGDYADVFFEYRVKAHLDFEDGILKSVSRRTNLGVGVRVRKAEAVGFACVEQLDWDAMERAAATAAAIASCGRSREPVLVQARAVRDRYDVGTVTLDVPFAEKRSLLERAARAAIAEDPRVVRVKANFSEELREIMVATSDGRLVRDTLPMVLFVVCVFLKRNGQIQEGVSGGGGRTDLGYFQKKSPEWHAKEAVRQAAAMLDAREAPAGIMEVVLAPGDSGILLHEAVGHGLEADFNHKGTSNYSGRMGQAVASDLCTVADDPTLRESRGSINVDDEGNEPHRNVLIERGRLSGYLHDRRTAECFKCEPTGNGRRQGFASAPMPRMTTTLLLAGEHAPDEIVKSVKRGVFVRALGGGQVNISSGDFVFSLREGYLVEDGKVTAPLRAVSLIGNGPEVLRKVTMLGNDLQVSDGIWECDKNNQRVPVGVGCPTIKISGMIVGGTQLR